MIIHVQPAIQVVEVKLVLDLHLINVVIQNAWLVVVLQQMNVYLANQINILRLKIPALMFAQFNIMVILVTKNVNYVMLLVMIIAMDLDQVNAVMQIVKLVLQLIKAIV